MRSTALFIAALAEVASVFAQVPAPAADGRYTISAPGIKAQVCSEPRANYPATGASR